MTGGVARRWLAGLGRLELSVVVAALAAICLLTAVTVVLRYFFEISVLWAQEISLLLFHVLIFSGAAVMYKARAYITMDFVVVRLPARVQRAALLVTWLLASAFAAIVLWQSIGLYDRRMSTYTYILELPRFYYTVPLVYGALSILLTNAYYAWASAGLLLRGEGDPRDLAAFEAATTLLAVPGSER